MTLTVQELADSLEMAGDCTQKMAEPEYTRIIGLDDYTVLGGMMGDQLILFSGANDAVRLGNWFSPAEDVPIKKRITEVRDIPDPPLDPFVESQHPTVGVP